MFRSNRAAIRQALSLGGATELSDHVMPMVSTEGSDLKDVVQTSFSGRLHSQVLSWPVHEKKLERSEIPLHPLTPLKLMKNLYIEGSQHSLLKES